MKRANKIGLLLFLIGVVNMPNADGLVYFYFYVFFVIGILLFLKDEK